MNTDNAITKARLHWALGDVPIKMIAARENHIYRIDTVGGAFALRLHRPGYRSLHEIQSELMWMGMLEDRGMSVPKPIPAIDGSTVKLLDGVMVDMLSWLTGVPLAKREACERTYYELGRQLAHMHEYADQWKISPGFTRPVWDLIGEQPSWGRFWENPALTLEQKYHLLSFRDEACKQLGNLDQADYGLIHADLVPDNVLCDNDELRFIDFDDGGFGYRLFDLATITHRSRRLSSTDLFASAVVEGYLARRQLDVARLPLFEALRACTYVGWNISRSHEPGGQERNARFVKEALIALEAL